MVEKEVHERLTQITDIKRKELKVMRTLKAIMVYATARRMAVRRNKESGTRQYVLATDGGGLLVTDRAEYLKRLRFEGGKRPQKLSKIAVWYSKGVLFGKPSPSMNGGKARHRLRHWLRCAVNKV